MLAYGKLSKDLMSHGHGGNQIGLEFSGKVSAVCTWPHLACLSKSPWRCVPAFACLLHLRVMTAACDSAQLLSNAAGGG
jgi:hypothetical protein